VTTFQAVLIFAGIPLAIVGLITLVVFATTARRPRPRPQPPVGLVAEPTPCRRTTRPDGREVHEPEPHPASGQPGKVCWTLRCAECGIEYREDADPVHFTGPLQAITLTAGRGWKLAGARMRCPSCA
jgi:hypothetical protein